MLYFPLPVYKYRVITRKKASYDISSAGSFDKIGVTMVDFSKDIMENEAGTYNLTLVFKLQITLEHIDGGISYASHLIEIASFPEYVRFHRTEIYQDYQVNYNRYCISCFDTMTSI